MQIGIITGEYPPIQGGVGAYSQILARQFVAKGHQVFIFSSHEAQNRDKGILLTNQIEKWNLAAVRMIGAWARDLDLDIVNVQFQTAAYGMSAWVHFLPGYIHTAPVVTTFHDLRYPYLFPKAGPLRDWIVMRLARKSAGAIVTNHEDFARLRDLPNVTMIPIGSNIPYPENQTAQPKRTPKPNEPFQIVHFGFINQSKGIETLFQAAAKLRRDGLPIRLIMLGGRTGASDLTNETYAQEIDALIASLKLTDCVEWTGYLDEEQISAALINSDVVVLPFLDGASYRRGSLMAAIAHGCAIITTTPQVAIPAFQDGENMRFVPAGNAQATAEAIQQVLEDHQLAQHLRQGAAALAADFDWRKIADETLAFYEQVIRGQV